MLRCHCLVLYGTFGLAVIADDIRDSKWVGKVVTLAYHHALVVVRNMREIFLWDVVGSLAFEIVFYAQSLLVPHLLAQLANILRVSL